MHIKIYYGGLEFDGCISSIHKMMMVIIGIRMPYIKNAVNILFDFPVWNVNKSPKKNCGKLLSEKNNICIGSGYNVVI